MFSLCSTDVLYAISGLIGSLIIKAIIQKPTVRQLLIEPIIMVWQSRADHLPTNY
jgi:hypothetical protein